MTKIFRPSDHDAPYVERLLADTRVDLYSRRESFPVRPLGRARRLCADYFDEVLAAINRGDSAATRIYAQALARVAHSSLT